ncbi:MAG: dTMP kinase [Planctomycetes bacterium]|nr:dTMP kinase [Planctomycetota bacterium]
MKKILKDKFIVLDGPDGCGKSTQIKMLTDWAAKQGTDVVSFRDPGTTVIGESIRRILLDPANRRMDTRTELLLYMAARTQLWTENIRPALEERKCVILDRWISSTCAYQGYAGGFGMEKVLDIAGHCLERIWPDVTVILDVDLKTASVRISDTPDRMEQKSDAYHQKVREGFLELARLNNKIEVVEAAAGIETIHKNIVEIIRKYF